VYHLVSRRLDLAFERLQILEILTVLEFYRERTDIALEFGNVCTRQAFFPLPVFNLLIREPFELGVRHALHASFALFADLNLKGLLQQVPKIAFYVEI